MTDLHAVVSGEIDRLERVGGPGLEPVFAALRAAMERHRPDRVAHRLASDPICVTDDAEYPCAELRAIADALRVVVTT